MTENVVNDGHDGPCVNVGDNCSWMCDACEQRRKLVIRYVATRLNKDGYRVLASAAQGRNTFATSEEAQAWIDAVRSNNNADSIAFLRPDTLEVRPCECWPGHFDPKGVYFDVVTTAGVKGEK